MTLEKLQSRYRDDIHTIAARHGVRNVRVFGSTARDQAQADSDLDVLVDLDAGRSLLDLGGFAMDLEELLGRRVDAQTTAGLHWYIRERILEEAVPI